MGEKGGRKGMNDNRGEIEGMRDVSVGRKE